MCPYPATGYTRDFNMPETLLEMPQLMARGSLTVYMQFDDHPRPHVHAYYQDPRANSASIQIDNQSVTKKSRNFPRRQLRQAIAWVKLNKTTLNQMWTVCENKDKLMPQQVNQKFEALKGQLKPLPKRRVRKSVLKERFLLAVKVFGLSESQAKQLAEMIAQEMKE